MIPVQAQPEAEPIAKTDIQDTPAKPITLVADKRPTLLVSDAGVTLVGTAPRITLLLPFHQSEGSTLSDRFVEFYEGFLMAVDSLKSLGLSFEVQALNVGLGTSTLKAILATDALDKTSYCIGGASPAQIELLSNWARKHKKGVILPFSSRIPEMANNTYLYQLLTSQEKMQERLAAYLTIRFAGSNYVLVKPQEGLKSNDPGLNDVLKKLFIERGTQYQELEADETLDEFVANLSDDYENVIVPHAMSLNESTRFVTLLAAAAAKVPEKAVTLIGYPEWQAMNRRSLQLLHQLNTHLFTSFYADFQQEAVRNFQVQYSQSFGKNLLNTFPKYGLMGYDLASYFIPLMVNEQTGLPLIKGPTPLQHAYAFRPEASGSGAFNQVFFFIHYTPEDRVDVKQLR